MDIVKVLKRKDGAALVVGIVVGLIVFNFVSAIMADLTNKVANTGAVSPDWQHAYLMPTVAAVLQLLAFEILIRIYVILHDSVTGK